MSLPTAFRAEIILKISSPFSPVMTANVTRKSLFSARPMIVNRCSASFEWNSSYSSIAQTSLKTFVAKSKLIPSWFLMLSFSFFSFQSKFAFLLYVFWMIFRRIFNEKPQSREGKNLVARRNNSHNLRFWIIADYNNKNKIIWMTFHYLVRLSQ